MTSYEIMLSESQERMLLVAERGREQEVLDVFAKWGLDCDHSWRSRTPTNRMRVRHHGELVADIPNEALTDDAPLYHRPVGTWKAPVPRDPPAEILAELSKPRDYTADLKKLLASAQHLLQALGLRAIRLHGADQHCPGPRRRGRRHAHQGHRRTRTCNCCHPRQGRGICGSDSPASPRRRRQLPPAMAAPSAEGTRPRSRSPPTTPSSASSPASSPAPRPGAEAVPA